MSTWLLILLILGALLLAFLIINGNKTHYSSVQILVDAPLDKSFNIAMDDSHMKEWLSSPQMTFESFENISGSENEIGSKWKLTFLERGKRKMEMIETVTHYVENEHFGMDLEDKMFFSHIDMKFNAEGDQTRIIESQTMKGKNMVSNAMMSLFIGQSKKIKQKMYDKLKEIIEREIENT